MAQQGAGFVYDPRMFGSPWDGIRDDKPGFDAMIAAIRANAPGGTGRVQLPQGMGYFSDAVHLTRPGLLVAGNGGGGQFGSGVIAAPGKTAFIIDCPSISPDGGDGGETTIEYVDFQSTMLVNDPAHSYCMSATRSASTFYEKGNCVIAASNVNPTRYFEVTSSGTNTTSSLEPPAAFASAKPNDTISDGSVTWTCRSFPLAWTASTVKIVGDRVRIDGYNQWMFEATAVTGDGKTSAGPNPLADMIGPAERATITDNHVTWVAHIMPCGVQRKAKGYTWHCSFRGFTGAAVHTQAGDGEHPATNADCCHDRDDFYQYCGMGLFWSGSDANVSTSSNCFGINLGWQLSGTGGVGIWDSSEAGGYHAAATCQSSTGPALRNDKGPLGAAIGNLSQFHMCTSENQLANVVRWPGMVIGGTSGGAGYGPESTAIIIGTAYGRGLIETDATGATVLAAGFTRQDGTETLLYMGSSDEQNNYVGWRYQLGPDVFTPGGGAGAGWYALSYGPYHRVFAVGVSGAAATEGPGHWREYLGRLVGSEGHGKQYRGVSTDALTANTLRGGHQLVGDKFAIESTGTAGTWDEYVVSVAGYRGVPWAKAITPTTGYGPYGLQPSMIEPTANGFPIPAPGSKVFKCVTTTDDGKTGNSEPNWSSAVNPGDSVTDNHVTWQLVGITPTYVRATFIDDPVYSITPQSRLRWRDTVATDGTTAAPKARVDSYRKSLQTTTNSANQVMITTDDLDDNAVAVIDVTITGKQNGNHAEALSAKLSGTFYRSNGSAPAPLGTDDNTVKGTMNLGASTFNLHVNGNGIDVRVTPGVNATVDWGIFVSASEGKS